MIVRFCLYGLLKNQRYFEAFWLLAFLDRGLSFALIGGLIGFRELSIALLEIPTGAVADVVGRRWSMIYSHVACIVAFITFGVTTSVPALFLAMFAFAIGEAFRTGTHKAIIFAWLKREGREKEKTRIYGITRSWSKMGSAVSVVIAAVFVFSLQDYSVIFWMSAIPAALNIVNFLGYPRELDEQPSSASTVRDIVRVLWAGTRRCFSDSKLRGPIAESMSFEGMYNSSKDYLQPIIQQAMLMLPVFLAFDDSQRTAVSIAVVYSVLYLLGSLAARFAGPVVDRFGSPVAAARRLWAAFIGAFLLLLAGTITGLSALSIASFLILSILQNLWRPILIGRIADQTEESAMATVLSVESQAKSFAAAVIAPLLGIAVELVPESLRFVPVAVFGIVIGLVAVGCLRTVNRSGPPDAVLQDSDALRDRQ